MLKFIKGLFCKHTDAQFVRNIYGDEIMSWGYKRSLWRCTKCGNLFAKDALYNEPRPELRHPARIRPPAPPSPPRAPSTSARLAAQPASGASSSTSTDCGTSSSSDWSPSSSYDSGSCSSDSGSSWSSD